MGEITVYLHSEEVHVKCIQESPVQIINQKLNTEQVLQCAHSGEKHGNFSLPCNKANFVAFFPECHDTTYFKEIYGKSTRGRGRENQ